MSGINVVGGGGLIDFFDTRAQEIAAAQQLVRASTTAVAASATAASDQGGTDPSGPRTITLELTQSSPPANSNDLAALNSSGGLRTIASVSAPTRVGLLTFDIAGSTVDGYPQRIDITTNARQTIHNTAVGFYVDEFNEGPGQLEIDVAVLYRGFAAQQIQSFFDLINKAKLTSPLANEPPFRLRYFDSYLQRKLVITQDNVRCALDADQPNRARLSISASILYDYSSPQPTAPATSAIVPGQAPAALKSSLLTLGTFSVNGTSLGNTIGAALGL